MNNCSSMIKWAREVKDRAENKCQVCGSTSKLVSHHIDASRPLSTDLDDGICVCRPCHGKMTSHSTVPCSRHLSGMYWKPARIRKATSVSGKEITIPPDWPLGPGDRVTMYYSPNFILIVPENCEVDRKILASAVLESTDDKPN